MWYFENSTIILQIFGMRARKTVKIKLFSFVLSASEIGDQNTEAPVMLLCVYIFPSAILGNIYGDVRFNKYWSCSGLNSQSFI